MDLPRRTHRASSFFPRVEFVDGVEWGERKAKKYTNIKQIRRAWHDWNWLPSAYFLETFFGLVMEARPHINLRISSPVMPRFFNSPKKIDERI